MLLQGTSFHAVMIMGVLLAYRYSTEARTLGLIPKQLEKTHGRLFQYMTTAPRLLYAQRWKDSILLTMEEWLVKLTDFADMDKLISLIREKTLSTI